MEVFWALAAIGKLLPAEQKYNLYHSAIWKYIGTYLTDDYHQGIYEAGTDSIPFMNRWLLKTPLNITEDYAYKGWMWKDAYHDGRALLRNIDVMKYSHTDEWLIFPLSNLLEHRDL